MTLPEVIRTEDELEHALATPYPETVELMRRLDGDIMILGAGGKMGPSLAHLARNACEAAGARKRVIAVSRFSDPKQRNRLLDLGIETISVDLLNPDALESLPRIRNIIFMAGLKFGLVGSEDLLWMTNAVLPANVARIFRDSNIVVFSTGCVYRLMPSTSGGSVESDPPEPVGEYSYSCLARERVFQYHSSKYGTPVLFFRLNYSTELRYGVLVDIAQRIHEGLPINRSVSVANVIWQGDANNRCLLCLEHTASPPAVLNVTGPEILQTETVARQFARLFGLEAQFTGADSGKAYLSHAARSIELFGPPRVPVRTMIEWIADWIEHGGRSLGKPTHFEVTDGQFLAPSSEGEPK